MFMVGTYVPANISAMFFMRCFLGFTKGLDPSPSTTPHPHITFPLIMNVYWMVCKVTIMVTWTRYVTVWVSMHYPTVQGSLLIPCKI